ncbi:hypothetical protein [Maribacter cobaltidurans]|uniref:Uncharacterized protein n=1 Tax=Maribacter cobaltidurans TaxID=1178778 RepID=A0A223V8T4_9FLAO|nr:hypothetical protein [Maribacter cobaltidurans]ASV31815.1 hypothetical protein CJ263_17215 [Maribacter cobaltidurans]GGD84804.1 hypothetical protein GCM10011412_23210 [Maribacter cobaltidurans]
MHNSSKNWSKEQLKVYLLLLSAQADFVQTKKEIDLIKSKTDKTTFDAIFEEFKNDHQDTSLQKIENAVAKLKFSHMELTDLREEINEVFHSDKKFSVSERYLDKLLDNLIY